MDLIILRAVALKITELERKSVPVLWATQAPEDLKRSQKIPETSQHTTGEPEKPCSFWVSMSLQECVSSNAIQFYYYFFFLPDFFFLPLPRALLVFLAVCSYFNSWKKTGGMTHLLSGNLCVLGRLWDKSFQCLTPWNCFKHLCWKYPLNLRLLLNILN